MKKPKKYCILNLDTGHIGKKKTNSGEKKRKRKKPPTLTNFGQNIEFQSFQLNSPNSKPNQGISIKQNQNPKQNLSKGSSA